MFGGGFLLSTLIVAAILVSTLHATKCNNFQLKNNVKSPQNGTAENDCSGCTGYICKVYGKTLVGSACTEDVKEICQQSWDDSNIQKIAKNEEGGYYYVDGKYFVHSCQDDFCNSVRWLKKHIHPHQLVNSGASRLAFKVNGNENELIMKKMHLDDEEDDESRKEKEKEKCGVFEPWSFAGGGVVGGIGTLGGYFLIKRICKCGLNIFKGDGNGDVEMKVELNDTTTTVPANSSAHQIVNTSQLGPLPITKSKKKKKRIGKMKKKTEKNKKKKLTSD